MNTLRRMSWLVTALGAALMVSALAISVDWIALVALIGGGGVTFTGIYAREFNFDTSASEPALQRPVGHGEPLHH